MQWSTSFRRNKRYIKNSNKLSSFIFDAVFLAPHGATEKHGDVPPQRRFLKKCLQNDSMFLIFRRSDFKLKAPSHGLRVRQIHRMIMPRSEPVRGALQEGL